jgi:hypothetical protein
MSPTDIPDRARRGALAVLAQMAGMIAAGGAAAAAPPSGTSRGPGAPTRLQTVDAEYRRLLPLWQAERQQFRHSSNTYDYWKGPHGRAIIALGPAILPHLIQELRKGDFWFNVPLALITKVDIADGDYQSEQANSALWLKWWDSAKDTAQP